MDAVAAIFAGAAAGGIHLGQCRVFLPRHHAGRRHADHRDGGDERLPQGTARQDFGPQRTSADPAAGTAADGLGGGRRAHFQGARGHAGRADRGGPGAGLLAVQCVGRAGARRARRRSRQAALRRQQHPAGHARRLRRRAGRGDREAAGRSIVVARGRQRDAGGPARRGHADGHDAAHQALQGRGRFRSRHVGIRLRVRVHAAARGAGLFQPRRRRHRHRGVCRQAGPDRPLPPAHHRSMPADRSS